MTGRVLQLTLAAACAVAALTAVAVVRPAIDLDFQNFPTHVAVSTGAATVALLFAYIVLGRFRRRGRLSDLLIAAALFVSALADLTSAAAAAAATAPTRFASWDFVAVEVIASATLVAASAAADRDIRRRGRAVAVAGTAGALALALALVALAVAVLDHHLPPAIDPNVEPPPYGPLFAGSVGLRVLSLVAGGLYAVAAVGLFRRARGEGDELVAWLALAATFAAGAGANYFVFASAFSRWVYVGDYMRMAVYLALLLAAARELAAYQRSAMAAAALEERRRLARELHDGLAQELAFISTQSRRLLARGGGDGTQLEQLALAAERALDESRSAIAALSRRLDEPLEVAVAQAAEDVAARVGIGVRFDLASGIELAPAAREALLRILREAVSNTARHGRASQVTVSLERREGVRLTVVDDGVGFDNDAAPPRVGFGLTSMRERAEVLGAELSVRSRPGKGTSIEVVIP